jgi:hypothetical protein
MLMISEIMRRMNFLMMTSSSCSSYHCFEPSLEPSRGYFDQHDIWAIREMSIDEEVQSTVLV